MPAGEIILAEGIPTPISQDPSFENTQVFFSALSFPIDSKNPPKPFGYKKLGGQTREGWARNWDILGRHLGTDAVLEEAGANEITRERVRQITKTLINQSYDSAPAALKEAFSRASLGTRKPYSIHKGMRRSEAKGGKMREVKEAVLAGKSIAEIKEETGVSSQTIANCRSKGIAVPYAKEGLGREYQRNLRFLASGLLDDRQILAIFEDIEKHNRSQVCRSLKKAGALVSLGKAARSVGVFIHLFESAAYRLMKELGIPTVQVHRTFDNADVSGAKETLRNYFYVLNNHEGTRHAFAHPSFDAFRTNPVEVLGRVPEEIPTTSILQDPAYIPVGKFLKKRGIPIRSEEVRKYLSSDFPVPVFFIFQGRNLLVRKDDSDALAVYFETKLSS